MPSPLSHAQLQDKDKKKKNIKVWSWPIAESRNFSDVNKPNTAAPISRRSRPALNRVKALPANQNIKENAAQYSHKDKVISGIKFYYSKDFHSRLNYRITVYAVITGDFR